MYRVIARAEKPSILVDLASQWLPEDEQRLILRTQAENAEKAVVIYGDENEISCSDQHILTVKLAEMPTGIELVLPLTDVFLKSAGEGCEMELIVLAFPYTSNSQFDMLGYVNAFLNCKPDRPRRFRIVMLNNVRTGITDLEADKATVGEIIKTRLEDERLSDAVDVISDASSLKRLFRGADRSFRAALRAEKDIINCWKTQKLKEYARDYDVIIRKTSSFEQDVVEKYIAFEKVRGSSDIMKKCSENFMKSGEWKAVREASCELFRAYIEPICCWDIEKDVQCFGEQLDEFAKKTFSFSKSIQCPVREIEYHEVRAKEKPEILFTKCIYDFIEKGLRDHIERQIITRGKVYFPDLQIGE